MEICSEYFVVSCQMLFIFDCILFIALNKCSLLIMANKCNFCQRQCPISCHITWHFCFSFDYRLFVDLNIVLYWWRQTFIKNVLVKEMNLDLSHQSSYYKNRSSFICAATISKKCTIKYYIAILVIKFQNFSA